MTAINSLDDFLQALDDNPAWRDAVRLRILGDDVLQLPGNFNALVEQVTSIANSVNSLTQQVDALTQRVDALTQRLDALTRQVESLTQRVDALTQRVDAITRQVESLTQRVDALTQRVDAITQQVESLTQRLDSFIEEQKRYNEELRTFVEEQKKINEELRTFVEEQKKINEDQRRFNEDQRRFNEDQRRFNEEQRRFNEEQRVFNSNAEARMGRIESDISAAKGGHVRTLLIDLLPDLAEEMELQVTRTIPREELVGIARRVSSATRDELRSFRRADLVVLASRDQDSLYLAIEASWTASRRDTDRAERNARFLAETTGVPAIPVIASVRNTREAAETVESGAVRWYQIEERDVQVE